MSIDKILVLIFGSGLIFLVYWFFFGKKNESLVQSDSLEILVSGGYNPSIIKVKKGKEYSLFFTRTDKNSCLEEIVIPDFKIKEYLPLNEKVKITINPKEKGEYPFHCGMSMFHGKVIVV